MSDEQYCDKCNIPYLSEQALGGHGKSHKHPRSDKPACFTDDKEWEFTISLLRIEHPSRKVITTTFALSEACAVCPLSFMQQMQSRGRCHPPENAVPQRDLGMQGETE